MIPILHKDISIQGLPKFESLTKLKITEQINDHATASISGILQDQLTTEEVYRLGIGSNIRINTGSEVIFTGVPVGLEIKSISGVNHLSVTLKSHSYKLDIKRRSRSFQDVGNTYYDVFAQIVNYEYHGVVFNTTSKEKQQGQLIIEYKETDWQFLKRLASQLNTIIYPYMDADKPQIGVGIPAGKQYTERQFQYAMSKTVGEYSKNESNFPGWGELDFVSDNIESSEVYKLCDVVIHNEVKYLVAKKISEMCNGVLSNTYSLRNLDSFKQNIIYNEKLTGISLEGKVIAVNGDKVKLHLVSIDQNQDIGTAYWFDYDTPYTAENHKGAYIMPENGTVVHLYFPHRDERRSYIRKVLRKDGVLNPKTKNPNIKYFETINGKELKLTPDSLSLTARHGKVYMSMTEGGGISFISSGDILIKGPEINVSGEAVHIKAADSLSMKSSSASILVETEIDIKGAGLVNFFG